MIRSLPLTLKAYPLTALFPINSECLRAFNGMFEDIPRNFWLYSVECLATFPGMIDDDPQIVSGHFPEFLRTFPGIFGNIPWNVWQRSPECLARFFGMFGDISRNITFPQFHAPLITASLFHSSFLYS